MKKVTLKQVPVSNSQVPENTRLNYRTEFLQACEISQAGLTPEEMRQPVKVARKLRSLPDEADSVLLEDAEWDWLQRVMQTRRFTVLCDEVIDMVQSLIDAPEIELSNTAAM